MNQAFEPFLQPFEKEHTEVLRGSVCISDADLRHFTTKQCIDFANAYRSAMESNDPELMNLAETAGSSAYHYLCKDGMLVEPFDAIRSASREAWLIDRMEPSPEKDALVTSYFDRLCDTLHNNPYIQIKPDQELQFAGGILDEIQTGRSYSNMRVMGTTPAAMFLSEYPAYAEARSFAESLASLENQNEVEL